MEDCYILLGISPTASTEEIESAYQNKKRELAPDRLKELDKAYNDAIMATFAPIKAFAVSTPLPILEPSAKRPENVSGKEAEIIGDLVTEAPVSFSDEQLLNMDIGELRESYASPQRSVLFTWGIEDRLLRSYVMAYVGFVILDLFVNLALGGYASFSIPNALAARQLNRAANVLSHVGAYKDIAQELRDASQQMNPNSTPPSVLVSILRSFVITAFYFFCALPMPIITRFFIVGASVKSLAARWSLYSFSVAIAVVLFHLTGWLFGNWSLSVVPLAFVTLVLSATTLKYEVN